jgi:hypothetical protein
MKTMIFAIALMSSLAGCQSSPDRVAVSEWHESRVDGDLVVFHPPGDDWEVVADSTLRVLLAGRDVATEQFGMEPPKMGVLLMEGGGGTWEYGTPWPHPETGETVMVFPMPAQDTAVLADDIRAGGSILGGETELLAAARHVALFLEVHEMWHAIQNAQADVQYAGLWLEEGLAEYLALRTAAQAAPDAVPEFLDMRLAALAGLPEDGVLDLLAWSVGEGEIVRVMTLADGESLKLRWSTQRPSEIERAVEQATHALDRLGPEQATQLAKDIRFWKELAEINRTKTGMQLVAGDHPSRWGVYGMLLAFFIELDGAGFDPEAFLRTLRQPEYARNERRQRVNSDGSMREESTVTVTATNAEILTLLPDIGGQPASELLRAYPVARARAVLQGY